MQNLYWSLLDKLKTSGKNDKFIRSISAKKWEDYLKNLLFKEDANEIEMGMSTETATNSPLDSFITIKEIRKIAQKLKSGRATGIDLISNEMLQILAECEPEILCHLFNKILFSSEFPEHWITGMLLPVHRKGSKSSPKNYRGIMLLSRLGKLFTSLLNERLLNYTVSNNILAREQIGFLKGNRTGDNLIILHSLIHKRFIERKKLFACFIDFEKA